jgi:hypothetical protein
MLSSALLVLLTRRVSQAFERNGLNAFRVEELTTHGESPSVFAYRADEDHRPREDSISPWYSEEAGGNRDVGVISIISSSRQMRKRRIASVPIRLSER